ncbi:hypothetical protein [Aliivibrio sp. EL58]|uniref:hypothetical protein n=1 Tax=Aliivibrio sp. EL58 TaxID=2107582 RepID=UPI000EFA8B63|nr:hypothetical protein [Aliivibrio sp. EL58]
MTDQQDDFMTEETLIETVKNQIEDGSPVAVKETLMRLVMTGNSREDAIEMMACALAVEVFDVMKNGAEFNQKRYKENLESLPDMSFMGDE